MFKPRSFGLHLGQRFHAATNKLFRSTDFKETTALYEQVAALAAEHDLTTVAEYDFLGFGIVDEVVECLEVAETKTEPLLKLVGTLLETERLFQLPEIDWEADRSTSEWWALRDELLRQKALFADYNDNVTHITKVILLTVKPLYELFPALGQEPEAASDDIVVPSPLIHLLSEPGAVLEEIWQGLFAPETAEQSLFTLTTQQLEDNIVRASGGDPDNPADHQKTPTLPSQSKIADPIALASAYFAGTPLLDFLDQTVPFAIPATARREHHHICAGTGFGKTQTLQLLINEDLPAVARGERSLVVIDSQDDLINTIKGLKAFAPGEPLHNRLVLIDPSDVEYPVALNLFDVGMERVETYDPLRREQLTNSILEIYDFVLGTLLDAGMTQKQSVIFRYVARLLLSIENATIHTLRDLLEPNGHQKFKDDIAKLDGSARHFFNTQFKSDQYKQTKQQLLWRLYSILENQTFERMFAHPKSKLDLYAELNSGKVILINTAKSLLKETGSQFFGRFFIALIAHAAQERSALKADDRMSTILYLDEAHEYCNQTTDTLLAQARKYGLGVVLAHQYLGQLDGKLQDAFATNTSIKFVGGVSSKDANAFAPQLRCSSDFIESQPKGTWAAYIRGVTTGAVPLRFPFGVMEKEPCMDAGEWKTVRADMRERYAVHHSLTPYTEERVENEGTDKNKNTTEPAEKATKPEQPAEEPVAPAPVAAAHAGYHIDLTATSEW